MQEHTSWHPEVISSEVAETAETLGSLPAVRDFYLAGGTALAFISATAAPSILISSVRKPSTRIP